MASRTPRREFERLVREHHGAVYRSASRVVGDAQAAEDVTQQVFLALLEGRLELSGGQEERAVLRWWAVRGALAHLRGERHRRTREEEREMPTRDEDPAEQAVQRDERGTLERLIGTLPADLRLALRLRFEEGLTFARMATALEVSEPTAHARVQRALQTLRVRLRGCGLAALALDLEPRLGDAPPATLPPGLPERLLALEATATSSAALLPIVAAAALLTVGVGAWAIVKKPRPAPLPAATILSELPTPDSVPPAVLESEQERTAVPSARAPDVGAPAAATQAQHGWVVGRVVDADGVPVTGARVTASTVERAGKFAREARQTTTLDDGGFELELPVLSPDGTSWTLSAVASGLRASGPGSLRVGAGERERAGELRLGGLSLSRQGPWSLALRVVAPDGRPVSGAVVQVLQRVVDATGSEVDGPVEARGVSEPGGWLVLEGDLLGRKRVHVEARSQSWSPLALELPLDGAHTEVVVLEPGLEIRGVLVDASGRSVEPVRDGWASDPQVYASARDPNAWMRAEHEPGGRFLIRGLGPEPHRVFLQSQSLSPICLEEVLPGAGELEIVVKRRDQPLDVGPHCPEVHGVLRDARTGGLVQAEWDDVEIEWLPEDAGLDFERDVLPNVLWPRPRQTMLVGELPQPRADFHLVGLRPGRQAVAARVRGFAPALSSPVVLTPGALVADLELRLERPALLEGVVLDVDGTPLADAWVVLSGDGPHSRGVIEGLDRDVRETDGRPAAWSRNLVQTGESGRFAFEGVPPSLVCRLVALHPRREPVGRADCRPGGAWQLQFSAQRVR